MKRQSHGKKILSLFLVLTLVFGLTGMIQIPVKAAADETKVLAEELEGYNRILPKDFESFSNERLGTQFQLQRGSKTNYVGNYNGKNYLDADVNFNGAIGSANCFRYWGTPGVENEIYKGAFMVWLAAVGEQYTLHFNYQDVDTNLLLGDISKPASDYGITGPGDDINLKILTDVRQSATDESKETVAYQVWVNDKFLHEGTFEETARARMGICAQLTNDSYTLTIKTPSEKQEVKPEAPVTPADPFEGYERITLADYTNRGAIITSWVHASNATYQGTGTMDKTYIDIDVNFNGKMDTNHMLRFFASDWYKDSYHLSWETAEQLVITRYDNATNFSILGRVKTAAYDIEGPSDWFNVKLKFAITPNATDSTKQTVHLQLYLNNKLAWEKSVEEVNAASNRNRIFANAKESAISTRVPLTEKDLEGYTPITLNDYDGTKVGQNGMVVTTVTAPATLTTQVASFNKTYLDMDVNLGAKGNQIQFHASARYNDCFTLSWTDDATMRFFRYNEVPADVTIANITASDFGISSPSDWFNVKLRTDITGEGTTQQTVTVQLWLNDQLAWMGVIEETRKAASRTLIGTAGTVQLRSASPDAVEELKGYTPIGLEYYTGATKENGQYNVSLVNGGSAFSAITRFDKTYINMDVNFNGLTAGKGGANVRFQAPGTYGDRFRDTYALGWNTDGTTLHFFRYNKDQVTEDLAMNIVAAEFGINSANDWINVKLRTDITGEGTTQQTATIQLWLNDRLAWMGTITENRISASRTAIYSSTKDSKSILVRSAIPASVEEAVEGYTSLNLDNYTGSNVGGFVSLTSANPLTAKISNFDKTYLDVDVNFKGATGYGGNNVRYQGSASYKDNFGLGWNDANTLCFYRYKADSSIETLAASIVAEDFGISGPSAWFNVKILTDIMVDPTNANHQTVRVQLWLNDKLAYFGVVEETRNASSRTGINAAGTVLLRNPAEGNVAEALEGYTQVTLEDVQGLGAARNEAGTVYQSAKVGEYLGTSFNKTYLDMDVQTNADFFLHYLMTTDDNAFYGTDYYRLTMSGTDMKVSQILGGSTKAEVSLPLGSLGYTAGEMFNLKIRTDISGTTVVMQFWYNNQYVAKLTFTESAVRTAKYMGIRGTGTGATVVRMPADGTVRAEVAYDLSKGAYLLTGADYFYVNGKKMPSGTALAAPNDYVIERIVDGKIADSKLVSLYYLGDVNLDGEAFEAGDSVYMDSHALEGIVNYGTPMKAAMKAADLNNDGKVTAEDFDLIKQIRSDVSKKDEILSKYYTDSLSYEYLGGKDVMPIGGFYGPTTDATLTDGMFSLIQESGINLITYSPADAASDPNRVQQALVLAEKYGIGMFVSDTRLNVIETDGNGNVTKHEVDTSAGNLAEIMAAYSNYDSFLGINVVDEPKGANTWSTETNTDASDTYFARYNYYEALAEELGKYANITSYVNMHGSQGVEKGTYAYYVEQIAKDVDVLSYDTYPYFDQGAYTQLTRLAAYMESLDIVRQASLDSGKPFWTYVQAGTDYRDDGTNEATATYKYTEADTLWMVNTSLAFGAKGIQYFPLLQPEYFSYDKTSETGHDYDRNGIIGANNVPTSYYAMVQEANKQIAAIDHVLMNAQSTGVIVLGDAKSATDLAASSLGRGHTFTGLLEKKNNTYTTVLKDVSGDDAMVGCFNYQGYEAYYVVNYDRTEGASQLITLKLNENVKYYTIADTVKNEGEGSEIALTVPSGAGVLVVLETLHTHSYGDWVVTTPATLAAVGQKEKTCVCGDKITEEIPKLAAVNEYGVTLRDDLSMNFKMDVDESIKDTAEVVITVGGKTTTQSAKDVVSVNVSAIQMNDTITVQVVNGEDKSEEQSFTVLQYAQRVLADEELSEYHQMVKEMLNYGGYAQIYFGHNTENLVNKDLKPEEVGKEEVPQEDVPVEIEGAVEGISAYGAALVFRNKIAVRYYFKVTGDAANYTFTANDKPYEPFTSGDYTCIEVADINPQDLEKAITVTVNDTLSFSYSPMTYIVRMSQKGTENMKPLMKALYNYYLAAEALSAVTQ